MPRNYADMQDLVEQKLQDTSNAIFDTTEIGYQIEEDLKDFSNYFAHIVLVTFKIESRHGTATSTSSNNLVDATKSQFVSTDPTNEKVIYNADDKTWAVVESYTDANTLGLSKDIMAANEKYYIFNKRCHNNKQVYIGDVTDYLWVDRVEYWANQWPRQWRNFKIFDEVLELDINFTPDDSDPANTDAYLDVNVYFAKPHKLSQLTDWVGELTADAVSGATSIAIDGLQTTGTIEEGEEFHLENHRTLYTVTADATISSSAATISFYPGLEAAASDNDDITFSKSTLLPQHEHLFADMVAARVAMNKSINYINVVSDGGPNTAEQFEAWGRRKLDLIMPRLLGLSKPRVKYICSKE